MRFQLERLNLNVKYLKKKNRLSSQQIWVNSVFIHNFTDRNGKSRGEFVWITLQKHNCKKLEKKVNLILFCKQQHNYSIEIFLWPTIMHMSQYNCFGTNFKWIMHKLQSERLQLMCTGGKKTCFSSCNVQYCISFWSPLRKEHSQER